MEFNGLNIPYLASHCGGAVVGTLAEQFMVRGVSMVSAWMRSASNPYGEKLDVTAEFSEKLKNSIMLNDSIITPESLLGGIARGKTQSFWDMFMGGGTSSGPATPSLDDKYWLLVMFSVPGGMRYITYYKVPDERVTFPPPLNSMSVGRMVPLNRQVESVVLEVIPPDADDDADVVLDMTRVYRMMCGPDGEVFGKRGVDMKLVISESLDDENLDKKLAISKLVEASIAGNSVEVAVYSADGERRVAK